MFSRLFTPWHGAATRVHPAHVDPTLDSCTRYPSLLGGQRQCRMRSLPKAPTHDQCRESNPRPLDLRSSALPTGPHSDQLIKPVTHLCTECKILLLEIITQWANHLTSQKYYTSTYQQDFSDLLNSCFSKRKGQI